MDTVDIPDRLDLRTLLLSIMILLAAYCRQKIVKSSVKFPRVNGVLASKAQIELANNLGIKHINYKFDGKYIDIAMPKKKIAIEYDGYYWHKGREKEDRKRAQELIDQGWKVLVISSKGSIPEAAIVRKWITELSDKKPYKKMVLD